ncbi:MAG: carboxypeptidase regulatory-like domain-containing protein, partial [Pedobacter sp.]
MLQLTLISPTLEPLSERLVFVKNKSMLNLAIKADKPAYGIKQRVTLTVSAKDSLKAVEGVRLSLAVIDETKVPFDDNNETTILSTLLLTSDLQGYIEKPNYYFNQQDEKKLANLDLLMLTLGFRRFVYKDLLADKFPAKSFMPEQGITISGTLRNKTGLPINKGTMLLTIPDKRYNKQSLTTAVGVFAFYDLLFNDSSKVTLSAKYNPNPTNLMMIMDGMPEPAVTSNKNKAEEILNIDSAMTAYLANSSKQYRFMRTIKEVVIAGAKAKKPSHSDHPVLSTLSMLADHIIAAETLGDCAFLVDCMKYKLTGVTFERDEFYLTRSYNAGDRTPMLIFLNGIQIDFNGINGVSTSDVESIEIFTKDAVGSLSRANNTNGVMVINTKKPLTPNKKKYTAEDLKKLIPDSHTIT